LHGNRLACLQDDPMLAQDSRTYKVET